MLKQLIVILFLFSFFGCAGHPTVSSLSATGGKQLLAAQTLELVENNTLFISSFEVNSYFFFDSSGKLFAGDIDDNKDTGHWDVSNDDELCLKMENWWHGDLLCYNVWRDSATLHLANRDGLILFTAKQSEGDSQHLFFESKKRTQSFRKSIRKNIASNKDSEQNQSQSTPSSQQEEQSSLASKTVESSYSYNNYDSETTVRMIAKDCPGCNLAFSNLKNADLTGANLSNTNLAGADLRGANLRRANLQGANLEDANLSHANMPGANLKNSNLKNANMRGANLYKADLTDSLLIGTNLEGADVNATKGLE